jgi:hypothetical protein
MPLFTSGEPDRGLGLEDIAEDGSAAELGGNLPSVEGVGASAVFNTPVGTDMPGPIGPGGKYEFTMTAQPGYHLSLATMFVQSNDLIYTFEDNGLPLFKDGAPISGDVTDYVLLYDVGTEVDQFPGAGLDQVIQQSAPDTGADDDDNRVGRLTADGQTPAADGFVYPATKSIIKVTVTPEP